MSNMGRFVFLLSVLLSLHLASTLDYQSRYNFADSLFHKIANRHQDQNVIVSPVSLQTVLAMTYMGAEGETAAELRKGLFLENFSTKHETAADYQEFLTSVVLPGEHLVMANRVYVGKNYEILPSYLDTVQEVFQAKAELINFADSTNAANAINAWVESKTNEKIKNVVDANSLAGDTAAILVNAVYFKAKWQHTFSPRLTHQRNFALNAQDTIQVDSMYCENCPLMYAELPEYDAKAIAMSYLGTDLKMVIALPNKVDGVKEMAEKLRFVDLMTNSERFQNETMDVYLPKFKFEFQLDAVAPLKDMNMTKLFDSTADLSAMVKTPQQLHISEVKHKAFIAVDEAETEAGASSFLQISARMLNWEFIVDHPFVFAIIDHNAVYFTGIVLKP